MIKDLIKLANSLDSSGYITEANIVDKFIKSAAAPEADQPKAPEVGFYECNHGPGKNYIYFDGQKIYNVKMPGANQYLALTFSTATGLRVHTNNFDPYADKKLQNKVNSKDVKITDRQFASAIRLAPGWYKKTGGGNNSTNYYYVYQNYSILKVEYNGSSSTISLYEFFMNLEGKGAPVKQEEYDASENLKNYNKKQAEKEAEETAEVPVMGEEILRAKRGKNLTDRTYTYATSPDGLSFSWRHIRSGRTGQFSKEKNPEKWVDAVRNLNEARTTEIK